MEYNLIVNNKKKSIIIEDKKADSFLTKIGNKSFHVSHKRIDNHTLRVEIISENGNRELNIFIAGSAGSPGSEGGKIVSVNGISYTVVDEDALFLNNSGKEMTNGIPDKITPPMPATVIAVKVKKNDIVKKGDSIIIISAMKMETTLSAPYNGRIISVNTVEGDKVMPGDMLVDIEKEE